MHRMSKLKASQTRWLSWFKNVDWSERVKKVWMGDDLFGSILLDFVVFLLTKKMKMVA